MEYKPSFSDSLYADIQPSYIDSLTHHGIKGMHWGVRRYQNTNGSLTPAGKKRYGSDNRKVSSDTKAIAKVIIGSALVAGVATGIGTVYTTNSDANAELDILTGPTAIKSCNNMSRKVGAYQALLDRDYTLKNMSDNKLAGLRNGINRDINTARSEADIANQAYNRLLDNTAMKIATRFSKKTRDKMEKAGQSVAALNSEADKMAMFGSALIGKIDIEFNSQERRDARKEYEE